MIITLIFEAALASSRYLRKDSASSSVPAIACQETRRVRDDMLFFAGKKNNNDGNNTKVIYMKIESFEMNA